MRFQSNLPNPRSADFQPAPLALEHTLGPQNRQSNLLPPSSEVDQEPDVQPFLIRPCRAPPAMDIPMCYPDPRWPEQFAHISAQLTADLTAGKVNFTSILQIGSTSISGLNAKPYIDILITIPPSDFYRDGTLPLIRDALRDGDEQGGYYCIGNGGLRERWSFKLSIRNDQDGFPVKPLRNVYVVPDGGIHHRSCVAFRDALRDEKNSDLKEEYGQLKWKLAARKDFTDIWQYAELKDDVVRKILKRAGLTDEVIDERKAMREEHWPEDLWI